MILVGSIGILLIKLSQNSYESDKMDLKSLFYYSDIINVAVFRTNDNF